MNVITGHHGTHHSSLPLNIETSQLSTTDAPMTAPMTRAPRERRSPLGPQMQAFLRESYARHLSHLYADQAAQDYAAGSWDDSEESAASGDQAASWASELAEQYSAEAAAYPQLPPGRQRAILHDLAASARLRRAARRLLELRPHEEFHLHGNGPGWRHLGCALL